MREWSCVMRVRTQGFTHCAGKRKDAHSTTTVKLTKYFFFSSPKRREMINAECAEQLQDLLLLKEQLIYKLQNENAQLKVFFSPLPFSLFPLLYLYTQKEFRFGVTALHFLVESKCISLFASVTTKLSLKHAIFTWECKNKSTFKRMRKRKVIY